MNVMEGRLRKNAYGRYYVTEECNGCGLCLTYSPANFAFSDDGAYCYVIQQPVDGSEEDGLWDAMHGCPLRCIKDDGDDD